MTDWTKPILRVAKGDASVRAPLRPSRLRSLLSRRAPPRETPTPNTAFHTLSPLDDRWMRINADRNLVASSDAALPSLVLVSDDGRIGSLVAVDLEPFATAAVGYRSLSALVDIFAEADGFALFLRSENRFLAMDGAHEGAPCRRGGRSPGEGATFRGLALPDVPPALQAYAADLRAARAGVFVPADLARASFLAALASCAPAADATVLRRVLATVGRQPDLLRWLADMEPADYWASDVLAPLVAPEVYRDGTFIGPDLDWLGDDYVAEAGHATPKTFGERLVYEGRATLQGRNEVCIVATARNEGLYLVDWIAYHLSIGVKRIHVYANDNDDGSDALLAALDRAGHIRFVRSEVGENRNAQGKAYGHAFRVNRSVVESTWCLLCDLDEYLVFDTGRFEDIDDYVAWATAKPTDVLMLCWGFVGPSGQLRWSADPVIDRFRASPVWADMYAKSLFRTAVAATAYPHFPIGASDRTLTYRNAVGDIRTSHKGESENRIWGRQKDDDPVPSMAFLAHYYYKSAEEFVVKHTRNRGDYPKKAQFDGFEMQPYHLRQFVKQFPIVEGPWPVATPRACAPAVDRLAATIRADADVARAEAQVRSLYLRRRDALVSGFVDCQAFVDLGEDARAFKRLLAGETPAASLASGALPR